MFLCISSLLAFASASGFAPAHLGYASAGPIVAGGIISEQIPNEFKYAVADSYTGTQYARGWLLGEEPEEALSLPPPGLGGDDESAHIERDDANDEALLSQRLQNLEDTVTVLANRQLDMAASMQALERFLLRNCPKGKTRARQ